MRMNDLSGARYGRLVVAEFHESRGGKRWWRCICDCGNETFVPTSWLNSGNTSSCGCLGIEARNSATSASNTTHGMSKTATYNVWFSMRARCEKPHHKSYPEYGGRGISVCERWMLFSNFLDDMGVAPPGLTLDRIDTNGNYEPSNCRWATAKEQSRNRRSNRIVEAFGEAKPLIEWAEDKRCLVSYDTVLKRLEAGWSPERAIGLPLVRPGYSKKICATAQQNEGIAT